MEPTIYYRCATCGCVHELYPSDVNVEGGASIECKNCGTVAMAVTRDQCTETPGGEEIDPPRHLSELDRLQVFRKELTHLLNFHSRELGSDTPDFILAGFLTTVLVAFDAAVTQRSAWYGRHDSPVVEANSPYTPPPEFSGARAGAGQAWEKRVTVEDLAVLSDDGPTVYRCASPECGALSLLGHLVENGCQCGSAVSPYYGVAASQFRTLILERDRLAAELQEART